MQRRLLLSSILAASLAACGPDKPAFQSLDITGAEYARGFSLPDQNGQVRTLADFKGKVTVVFFGFTQCPDVCPTALLLLAEVKRLLGADGEKLQGVFITVDPERDTPEVLKAYMTSFDPSFLALRGTLEQVEATAKDFKVFYKKVEGKVPGAYTMEHTAASFIFDPQGRIRLYVRPGQAAQAMADDIRLLLKGV